LGGGGGGIVARPRKRRRPAGDIATLKRVLWDLILDVEALRHHEEVSSDLVLRVAHALSQLAGTYLKILEVHDLATKVAELEAAFKDYRRRA